MFDATHSEQKFEYLSPVRVCRKCARLCWKAEALVQAIQANDVNSLVKYVQRKNDCNLHIGVFPPLTVAAVRPLNSMSRAASKMNQMGRKAFNVVILCDSNASISDVQSSPHKVVLLLIAVLSQATVHSF